ncbi:phosphatase PAP2 family protein [Chryseobacterium sp. MHB01]|uniref:phosphatase PAP2 family protein n=1 Tax=unclassified Chryseobacterium TaxID=2593645 RepID=UPI002AFEC565|nr:phosphatase PAP2 family protein [Chryseobacterium sp. MHB01]MEA1847581.1 phosphatase PAP2 family protein [Chryseobacterium sp. MHB01]
MNTIVIKNYSRLKLSIFLVPLALLILIVGFLYSKNALSVKGYIQAQKECFYNLNSRLGQFPNLEYNLTQFGDALIFSSFLALIFISAPKMWEALLSASLLSCLFSSSLKKIFAVPRPAGAFDNNSFVIVGKTLAGHNSIPSGHSITIFTSLTIVLFAFFPKKIMYKILWIFAILFVGFILILTRVGVGAHYPLDTIIGGIIGFVSGLVGIFICRKYKIWSWIGNKKYYPIFILLFSGCCISLINRIINENLIIFYLAFVSLVVSLYKIVTVYVKK